MSVILPTPTSFEWAADVLEFARVHRVDGVLEPLRQATWELFPKRHDFRVFLEDDPEIRDDWHIAFEVIVSAVDVPQFVKTNHSWVDELFRCCPAALTHLFRLYLLREP